MARADTKLFNRASQVAIVRNGDRTVLTISNDFQGELKEFAVVVPVPTFLERDQIHVGDRALLDHLDAYSSPRLVEYFDPDPCGHREEEQGLARNAAPMVQKMSLDAAAAKSLGVTIEARYSVGEYDILILSARESGGLETWLKQNGYRVPEGRLGSSGELHQAEHALLRGQGEPRASRRSSASPTCAPFRWPTSRPSSCCRSASARSTRTARRSSFVFILTRKGRVETTNYRTVRLPSDMDVPVYVKGEFPAFYRALFAQQVRRERHARVFTEYAWDMNWCDPCAADPLSRRGAEAARRLLAGRGPSNQRARRRTSS